MKPRQPYRSPFWRPEFEAGPHGASPQPRGEAPTATTPMRGARPATPARQVPERAGSEREKTYAPSDLALFDRLMAFGERATSADPMRPVAPPQRAPAGARHAAVGRAPAAGVAAYTSRDAQLFQQLQSAFAGIGQRGATPPRGADGVAPSRGYSAADLEAFDRLATFGRSG